MVRCSKRLFCSGRIYVAHSRKAVRSTELLRADKSFCKSSMRSRRNFALAEKISQLEEAILKILYNVEFFIEVVFKETCESSPESAYKYNMKNPLLGSSTKSQHENERNNWLKRVNNRQSRHNDIRKFNFIIFSRSRVSVIPQAAESAFSPPCPSA